MNRYKTILSASRMCDMPKYYPEAIISETMTRISKGVDIHTLVLWTKHPRSLLANPLYDFLKNLTARGVQLFIQLTITGMGGAITGVNKNGAWQIEPGSPSYAQSLEALPGVIELTGSPRRIKIRIDPLIKVKDYTGVIYSNISTFDQILESASGLGIDNFSFSLLEPGFHAKVDRRFKSIGCEIIAFSGAEREALAGRFKALEAAYKVKINACCVEGFNDSACIDGRLLSALHPAGAVCDLREPRRRPKCGCVKSIDLGGWPVKRCGTGCDYCYANPLYSI